MIPQKIQTIPIYKKHGKVVFDPRPRELNRQQTRHLEFLQFTIKKSKPESIMNASEFPWLSELGLDNAIFMDDHESEFLDSYDEELLAAAIRQDFESCLSPGRNSSSSSTFVNVPSTSSLTSLYMSPTAELEKNQPVQPADNNSNFTSMNGVITADQASSSPIILNFGNSSHPENPQQVPAVIPEEEVVVDEAFRSQGSYNVNFEEAAQKARPKKRSRVRPPSQTYDHIIAERKRREQLSQLFIALSAIVPGLKKTDKSSVLGDAIKYLKHLQERVEALEEQASKQTMESIVLVRKSQIMEEDEGSSNEKSGSSDDLLPEIEARVCNNNILLRVQCEKQKGILVNLLSKVDSLNLTIINTNVIPFGNLALDITVIAEMGKEFSMNVKEVVTALRSALQTSAA